MAHTEAGGACAAVCWSQESDVNADVADLCLEQGAEGGAGRSRSVTDNVLLVMSELQSF